MTLPGPERGETPRRRRAWRWRLVLLLVLCLQPILLFVVFQRRLIYHPLRETPDTRRAEVALRALITPVEIATEDGLALHGWFVPAGADGDPKLAAVDGRPLCLWFNGNAGHRAHRLPQISLLHGLDAHVLIVDYRGYAENPGSPSEAALVRDARVVWNFARETMNVPAGRILICGESLGGGVATPLAADLCREGTAPGGLFLQATFASLVEAGSHHYPWLPVRWVLRDRFDSLSRIPDVTCPIAMVHGRKDWIVPFEQGRRLFDAAPAASTEGIEKVFLELPAAGHNDIMDPDAGAIDLWTQAIDGLLMNVSPPVEPSAP